MRFQNIEKLLVEINSRNKFDSYSVDSLKLEKINDELEGLKDQIYTGCTHDIGTIKELLSRITGSARELYCKLDLLSTTSKTSGQEEPIPLYDFLFGE